MAIKPSEFKLHWMVKKAAEETRRENYKKDRFHEKVSAIIGGEAGSVNEVNDQWWIKWSDGFLFILAERRSDYHEVALAKIVSGHAVAYTEHYSRSMDYIGEYVIEAMAELGYIKNLGKLGWSFTEFRDITEAMYDQAE